MRNVFSAIRRSLASVAIVFASSKHGARRMSRSVARTERLRGREGFSPESSPTHFDPATSLHGLLKTERGAGIPSPLLVPRVGPPVRWVPADLMKSTVLLSRSLRHRQNRYEHPALGFGTELDATVDQREQAMVLGQAYIGTRVPLGAALARDDVAGKHVLAAENLQAEPLTVRVAAVAG